MHYKFNKNDCLASSALLLSDNNNVGCAMCVLSDDTYITSIINLDTTIDEAASHRFTCMVSYFMAENCTINNKSKVVKYMILRQNLRFEVDV